jgi:hypothetical protein
MKLFLSAVVSAGFVASLAGFVSLLAVSAQVGGARAPARDPVPVLAQHGTWREWPLPPPW